MNGQEIKALRSQLGLTQKALAEEIGGRGQHGCPMGKGRTAGPSDTMRKCLLAVAESLPSGTAVTGTPDIGLDPYHGAILAHLSRRLDPELFEQCAVQLLRIDWPALVPVRGGQDQGFDGAVADRDLPGSFLLAVTTGKTPVRNLRTSLNSAKRNGRNPRQALFATSQPVTPATRRKLRDAAKDAGVTLVQTYDRDWFAGCLYHHPQWCKRLLGLTGRPRALSVYPVSHRPVLGDHVLGRKQEKKWILGHRGDCLIVGEPASGKTFLLRALALEKKALFLVDGDREQIANDIRELEPERIIVDDAHVSPSSIGNLVQIRSAINADFRIIATCWPGYENRTGADLQISQSDVLKLNLVDADTMIEIIKSMGLSSPDELLRIIRKQAAGPDRVWQRRWPNFASLETFAP